jgi:chemotaxis protein methyltransferase CheR
MSPAGWTDPGYEPLLQLLGVRTGLAFAPSRRSFAEAGIRRAMAKVGIARTADYFDGLCLARHSLDDLITEMTVGETYFFREPAQLGRLRCEILPEIRRRRGSGHVLRVWSAGCASGEEPYSLAILLEEEGLAERSRVLATDISRAALIRARKGAYGEWSFRGDRELLMRRYFRCDGTRFTLVDRLRSRVKVEYLNLALDTYPSSATDTAETDVILCRNVLIYFDRDTVRQIAGRLFDALSDGGWLITGASDPLLSEYAPFDVVSTSAGLLYRRNASSRGRIQTLPPPTRSAMVPIEPALVRAAVDQMRSEPSNPIAAASDALLRGDYAAVLNLTEACGLDPDAYGLRIRALANCRDVPGAERAAADVVAKHPLSSEVQFLHAALLIELGNLGEAAHALRRVIYLDNGLAIAHLALGSVLQRLGDTKAALRAYHNGHALALSTPVDEVVRLSDGETAGRLATAAAAQIAMLGASVGKAR